MDQFGLGVMLLLGGGLAALLLGRWPRAAAAVAVPAAIVGSLLALANAVEVLRLSTIVRAELAWPMLWGHFKLEIDPLSALFIVPIAGVVAVAALYGSQYLRGSHVAAGPSWFFFNLLAATMLLVVTARNGLLFLLAWEGMSLASFFLVLGEYRRDGVRRAAWIYLVAMHLGTAALLVLFLLLGRVSGSLDFDRFALGAVPAGVVFLLALVGFGTKAGLMPLHVWLPEAHPAAPSHVSAVMSGVMIKTGIYGLLRTWSFLGELPAWCGWTLVAVGTFSGVTGVVLALAQRDLKRLLAYSSVENIGIITVGMGVGMLGISYRMPTMAALGLLGALLHVLNHAWFKSLLFLAAGAIQHSTGTRDMDRLGGLLKRMPVTGTLFLVGAGAIAGLPPLNGFLSELLIYLGVLAGAVDPQRPGGVAWALLCLMVIGGLALVGGLASTCFSKALGGVFLGEPRSDEARAGHEVGRAMQAAMGLLAAGCVASALVAPLWPNLLWAPLVSISRETFGQPSITTLRWSFVPLGFVAVTTWALLVVVVVLLLVRKGLLARRPVGQGPTWDCGYVAPNARMEYTPSSFTSPLVLLFRMLVRPRVELKWPHGFFPRGARYVSELPDAFYERLYRPLFAAVGWGASKLRWLQQGRIQAYVLYIALTILVLLIWKLG